MAALNLFFLHQYGTTYHTSPDGITWTVRSGAPSLAGLHSDTLLFGAQSTGAAGAYSTTDGISWTRRSSAVLCRAQAITRGGGRLVAVSVTSSAGGGVYPTIISDDDGQTWAAGALTDQFIGSRVVHNGSYFVASDPGFIDDDLETYTRVSTNGVAWTTSSTRVNAPSAFRSGVGALFWNGSVWVSLLSLWQSFDSAVDPNRRHFTSSDGLTWAALPTSPILLSKGGPITPAVFVDGVWHIALRGNPGTSGGLARSVDGGITWQAPTTVPGSFLPTCVGGYIGKLIAVDQTGGTVYQSSDKGISWTTLATTSLGVVQNYARLQWVGEMGAGASLVLPKLVGAAAAYGHGSSAYALFPLYAVPAPTPPTYWSRKAGARERA